MDYVRGLFCIMILNWSCNLLITALNLNVKQNINIEIYNMNLIILGIMALCGASLNKIAIVAIVLGVFDVLRDIFENISTQ